jgi:hypothetical protein
MKEEEGNIYFNQFVWPLSPVFKDSRRIVGHI